MNKFINVFKKIIIVFSLFIIIILTTIFTINLYIKLTVSKNIISVEEAQNINNYDCILVLGCGIINNSTPSDMLHDRLKKSIELYNHNVCKKIIMSGDHLEDNYNEVAVMKDFVTRRGVLSSDIFLDHLGLSTFESIERAKEIFNAKKILIVTQKYHLYRALYIAKQLNIEAYGIKCNYRKYLKPIYREFREILARNKDFFKLLIYSDKKYFGNKIDLDKNGNITNYKNFLKNIN